MRNGNRIKRPTVMPVGAAMSVVCEKPACFGTLFEEEEEEDSNDEVVVAGELCDV